VLRGLLTAAVFLDISIAVSAFFTELAIFALSFPGLSRLLRFGLTSWEHAACQCDGFVRGALEDCSAMLRKYNLALKLTTFGRLTASGRLPAVESHADADAGG